MKTDKTVPRETPPLDDLGTIPRMRVEKILQNLDKLTWQQKLELWKELRKHEALLMENKK